MLYFLIGFFVGACIGLGVSRLVYDISNPESGLDEELDKEDTEEEF